MEKTPRSVMIVSKREKMVDFIKSAMPPERFAPVYTVSSAASARRTILGKAVDIVVIDTPLSDEFGTRLAADVSRECAAAIIVKPELVERTAYKLEPFGVVTLPGTLYKSVLYQTLMLLSSSVTKVTRLRESTESLNLKLREIKKVTKAKAFLISEKGMTEEQAHRYIEKTAMDRAVKKSEIADEIIREFCGDDY
ncbi:MAG: ANTAR domain-containing protein [Clostridia bacterium]|nr:ANTAR domain-containing protein [Clostridia bacterium]